MPGRSAEATSHQVFNQILNSSLSAIMSDLCQLALPTPQRAGLWEG